MTSTLLIVQFVLAVLIVIVVLLQKSSSIGLGAYSGSNESLFGAKGPANFQLKTQQHRLRQKLQKLQLQCLRNKSRRDNFVRRSLFTNKRANGEIY